jgi:hypothetical protein
MTLNISRALYTDAKLHIIWILHLAVTGCRVSHIHKKSMDRIDWLSYDSTAKENVEMSGSIGRLSISGSECLPSLLSKYSELLQPQSARL